MSIRVKKNYLTFRGEQFQCSIGRSGFSKNKKEGDGFTPIGTFYIEDIYYRADKIENLDTNINKIIIDREMVFMLWFNFTWIPKFRNKFSYSNSTPSTIIVAFNIK